MVIKQLNIKKRTYYLYNDSINLDGFNADLLKLDKKGVMNLMFITLVMLQKNLLIILIVLILYI